MCAMVPYGSSLNRRTILSLPDELQFGANTSEVSKAIGATLKLSPTKLDNVWRGYTGTMGMFLLQSPDYLVEEKRNQPAKELKERAFIRDFFLNDMNMNRTNEDFYNLVDTAQKQHAGYGRKGKPTMAVAAINKAMRAVSKQNKEIQEIIAKPSVSPERKRQMIDSKKKIIHQIQKATLKRYGDKFGF